LLSTLKLDSRGDWGAREHDPRSGASPQGQGEPVEVGRDSSGEQKIKVKKDCLDWSFCEIKY